jgi:hypothetical protein
VKTNTRPAGRPQEAGPPADLIAVTIDEPGHRYQAVPLLVLRLGGVEVVSSERAGRPGEPKADRPTHCAGTLIADFIMRIVSS